MGTQAKWKFRYLVVHPLQFTDGSESMTSGACSITTFMYVDTATEFARLAGGTVWPIKAVQDYGRTWVQTKDGAMPLQIFAKAEIM